jgi:hypothetical protein
MGLGKIHKTKVQDEINLHNQEKKVVSVNQMKMVWWI